MEIRPQSKPAQVDSPPKIIRVRGVVVSEAVENRRLKWTGSAYAVTPDVIEFFPDSGGTAHELEEDEEAMCVWMPAAARWEEFPGGGTADFIIGQTTATVADTDATFTIDNIFCVSGTDPRTDPEDAAETLSAKNSLSLELENNHKVFAYKNKAGAWETWADTSGAGVPAEFYMTIKGVLGGSEGDAITASTSTFTISSLALVNGTEVPGSLTVTNNPPLHAPPGATIYARYNLLVGSGDTDHWDTASSKNFLYMVKGVGGWLASSLTLLVNEGDDNPQWVLPDDHNDDYVQGLSHKFDTDGNLLQWTGLPSLTFGESVSAASGGTDIETDSTDYDIVCGIEPPNDVSVENPFNFTVAANDPVLFLRKFDAATWYAISAPQPRVALAITDGAVAGTSFNATGFEAISGKPPDTDPAEITNPFLFHIDDAATIEIAYKPMSGEWYVRQAACPS